ncbi:MAG TPA: cytochrome P460 family protein [Acidobacteriaceae bacterium]|nr:cytochrome P460 family protein [Acidobacteriaceae bacterium]
MKLTGKLILVAAAIFLLLQLFHPSIPTTPATAATPKLAAPPQVVAVLRKDCYACHSDERRLAWFDQIEPAYFLVRKDVLTARDHLNFSTLGSKPAAAQQATLYEAVNMMQLGAMPLPRFTALHPDAKVTPEDLAILKAYLAPWSTTPLAASTATMTQPRVNMFAISPEYNGLAFDPSFVDWKPLSFTDRGDNNTFRFILGNDIAIQAAASGNIHPWPDGTRFAKIAWQQEKGSDGLIHPGKFVQVELMVKDARLYKQTAGWGWGRWRGLDLKPYGKDAAFTGECTTCHLPMRDADDVYTLPISTAASTREESLNNAAAALPPGLSFNPLTWRAITLFVDPAAHTMSALYSEKEIARGQPPTLGSRLALVTWQQRDDPHWFGGRIPDKPISVEVVTTGPHPQYERFDNEKHPPTPPEVITQREALLLGLAPAPLP